MQLSKRGVKMPEFKTFKELETYLKTKIKDSLEHEVKSEIVETERRHIQTDVYDVYKPKMYKRRKDNGGLMDKENIIGTMISNDTLEIINNTPPNPYGTPQERVSVNKDLPMLVEGGDGVGGNNFYDFPSDEKDATYMFPRPFTANTIEELSQTKAHVKAFKEGLKRNGIETE